MAIDAEALDEPVTDDLPLQCQQGFQNRVLGNDLQHFRTDRIADRQTDNFIINFSNESVAPVSRPGLFAQLVAATLEGRIRHPMKNGAVPEPGGKAMRGDIDEDGELGRLALFRRTNGDAPHHL
ncbi:hypothetical protein D9M70_521460 [compost metagenome]